jgi:hypothetical protein
MFYVERGSCIEILQLLFVFYVKDMQETYFQEII